MIKNIIFDIGNVLLKYEPVEYLKTKNLTLEQVIEIHEQIFKSEEWIMLDRGTITEEEAKMRIVNRHLENEQLIHQAFENWYEMLTPIEDSVRVLKELKDVGYQIYYLSNFHLLAFEEVTNKYDFLNLFDGGVVSYQENCIKPEPEIYQRIVTKYQLQSEESIFIDDRLENIEAAQHLNFNTIHLQDPTKLQSKLKDYGITL